MRPDKGCGTERLLGRVVIIFFDRGVALAAQFAVAVDSSLALPFTSFLRGEHQQRVAHEVAPSGSFPVGSREGR